MQDQPILPLPLFQDQSPLRHKSQEIPQALSQAPLKAGICHEH